MLADTAPGTVRRILDQVREGTLHGFVSVGAMIEGFDFLLPGVADLDTLRYFSGLVGDEAVREQTRTTGPGYETRSESQARRALAPPEQLRQLPDGHALLVYGRL